MTINDEPPDPFEDDPTNLDGAEPLPVADRDTRTYVRSPEFLAGREAGFKHGVDVAIEALTTELVRAGCTREEIAHIVARIKSNTTR